VLAIVRVAVQITIVITIAITRQCELKVNAWEQKRVGTTMGMATATGMGMDMGIQGTRVETSRHVSWCALR
jgi:hypothetical protein